jgi:hypothetical protein
VFIGETWTKTSMAPLCGWGPRGRRFASSAGDQWAQFYRLCGADPGYHTQAGDIVIMDNLSSQKGPRVRELIESAGASLRFLPPYSADFNPIEKLSPSSRRSCEKPPSAPSTDFGAPSAASSTCSPPTNAGTTSKPQDTMQHDRIPL